MYTLQTAAHRRRGCTSTSVTTAPALTHLSPSIGQRVLSLQRDARWRERVAVSAFAPRSGRGIAQKAVLWVAPLRKARLTQAHARAGAARKAWPSDWRSGARITPAAMVQNCSLPLRAAPLLASGSFQRMRAPDEGTPWGPAAWALHLL